MYIGSHVKCRYSCQILKKLDFCRQILENPQISYLVKIRPVGAELFHADRRTDMTKLIVAFRYFANVPNYYPKHCSRCAMYFLYDINRILK